MSHSQQSDPSVIKCCLMFSVNYNALLIIEMFYANGSIRQQINEEFYSASMYGASETRSYYSKECF